MKNVKRFITVTVVMCLFVVACLIRLASLQIVNGEENYQKSLSRIQRTLSVTAPRGEIYDRYGRAIVANRMGFSVEFQRVKNMDDTGINETILRLYGILERNGDVPSSDELPITRERPYSFSFTDDEDHTAEAQWKEQMEIPSSATASEVVEKYVRDFHIDKSLTQDEKRLLAGVRYSMLIRGFGTSISYVLANDVSKDTVVSVKEHYGDYRGVNIITKPVREYPYGNLGAHILGRVGLIDATEYDALKNYGYGLKDQIGKQGLEKYLEPVLRGTSGKTVVEQDEDGHYISYIESEPAISGNSVFLTIDIDLQRAASEALKEAIDDIYAHSGERGHGADVSGGAAVAIDVTTGEILCMASYPDYSVENFSRDYADLLNDRNNPLFNRALSGTYSPGSTFKMLVGIAALEEDVIEPDTLIYDEVIYKLGESRYKCLHSHGYEDVAGAVKDSCNYFFYTVGYKLGIDRIAEYAKKFGLGEHSGIELESEEALGTVASPETKAKRNEPWYDGYTVQAAIGQDDNKYTPLQLAAYVAQIAQNGVRYTPHLIKSVHSYTTEDVIETTEIRPKSEVTIGEDNIRAIQSGMRQVATDGTAASCFSDYEIAVAAKTGTAEVYGGSDNGIFVAYAPYENPKIAVAVVIERAGGGSYCGPVAKAIIDEYLNEENEPENTVSIDRLY